MADYTLVEPMDPGIEKLMDNYFDVMHFQDMSLFDKVFHKDCVLYSAQGGELSIRPYAIYREAVATHNPPLAIQKYNVEIVLHQPTKHGQLRFHQSQSR